MGDPAGLQLKAQMLTVSHLLRGFAHGRSNYRQIYVRLKAMPKRYCSC